MSSTGRDPLLRSDIEVERKFTPTSKLMRFLNRSEDGDRDHASVAEDRANEDCSAQPSTLSFNRLPDKSFRDTYYDINDQLSENGIWIRRRDTGISGRDTITRFLSNDPYATLEAKVRLGGDYTDSQFHEIEGWSNVAAALSKRLAGVKLEELEVSVDLVMDRRSWLVKAFGSNAFPVDSETTVCIVLDEVTEPFESAQTTNAFKHRVGELEITKQIVGGTNEREHAEMRKAAAEQMDLCLRQFVLEHSDLFSVSPRPKGKLSAYTEWSGSNVPHRSSGKAREQKQL